MDDEYICRMVDSQIQCTYDFLFNASADALPQLTKSFIDLIMLREQLKSCSAETEY